ncbi:MAG: DUF4160 domain-containing protein [Rhizobiales bacterium]|nr:DUF4160 domain-containing protein [Hyphomicrobiales bacterium]
MLRHRSPDVLERSNPPHLHALYQGHKAIFEIQTGRMIGGTMPPGAQRMLRDWTLRHRDELMANWERGRLREAFRTIRGADEE